MRVCAGKSCRSGGGKRWEMAYICCGQSELAFAHQLFGQATNDQKLGASAFSFNALESSTLNELDVNSSDWSDIFAVWRVSGVIRCLCNLGLHFRSVAADRLSAPP